MQVIYLKHARRNWSLTLYYMYLIWKFGGSTVMIGEKVSPVKKP